MAISAADIKTLRERSGAGMMDCKKALAENDGDLEQAIDWLRQKGLAAAAKKAGRVAAEGLVAVASEGFQKASIAEVNAETDFVARNDQFQQIAKDIAKVALEAGNTEATAAAPFPGSSKNVQDAVAEAVGTIGENLQFRRSANLSVSNGAVASYIHNAIGEGLGKIGVLVALESDGDAAQLQEFGRKIAMHVAAARPESLDRDSLDPALIERERQVLVQQAMDSGKPKEIAEKMVEGRLRKYYEEVCLLDQVFVIDGKAKVSEAVEETEKTIGSKIKLAGFVRFQLGEGIEKEEDDFASEVAKAAAGA